MQQELSLEKLLEKFNAEYNLNKSDYEYLIELIKTSEHQELSNDAKLAILVEEVEFFLEKYIKSANRFRFFNDLLNKDRARVIKDQLSIIQHFFSYLLSEIEITKVPFCDENTLVLIFEAHQKMEDTLDKYGKYVFL